MFDKLRGVENRFTEIETLLSDPEKYVREHAELIKIVTVFRRYKQIDVDIEESQELLKDGDADIKNLAQDEIATLSAEKDELEAQLKTLLLPRDPNDDKNVIIEIRAGTGGEEAALFSSDLYRMYSRYEPPFHRSRRLERNHRHGAR
jgi:peptide chain release factor 1